MWPSYQEHAEGRKPWMASYLCKCGRHDDGNIPFPLLCKEFGQSPPAPPQGQSLLAPVLGLHLHQTGKLQGMSTKEWDKARTGLPSMLLLLMCISALWE